VVLHCVELRSSLPLRGPTSFCDEAAARKRSGRPGTNWRVVPTRVGQVPEQKSSGERFVDWFTPAVFTG